MTALFQWIQPLNHSSIIQVSADSLSLSLSLFSKQLCFMTPLFPFLEMCNLYPFFFCVHILWFRHKQNWRFWCSLLCTPLCQGILNTRCNFYCRSSNERTETVGFTAIIRQKVLINLHIITHVSLIIIHILLSHPYLIQLNGKLYKAYIRDICNHVHVYACTCV